MARCEMLEHPRPKEARRTTGPSVTVQTFTTLALVESADLGVEGKWGAGRW